MANIADIDAYVSSVGRGGPGYTLTYSDYDEYINQLSPDQLYSRYNTGQSIGVQGVDEANKFAFDTFKVYSKRSPSESEFLSLLPLAAQGKGAVIQNLQAQFPVDPSADITPDAAANSASNIDSSATGLTTSTPGGSATSFASKYSPVLSLPAPTVIAPASDSSNLLLGLVGAVIFYFAFLRKSHG